MGDCSALCGENLLRVCGEGAGGGLSCSHSRYRADVRVTDRIRWGTKRSHRLRHRIRLAERNDGLFWNAGSWWRMPEPSSAQDESSGEMEKAGGF